MEARKGFVFYESYYKVLKALGPEECRALLTQMCEYALYGTCPEAFASELSEGLWCCFFPSLQKGRVNAENRMKNREKAASDAEQNGRANSGAAQKRRENARKERESEPAVLVKKDPFAAPETQNDAPDRVGSPGITQEKARETERETRRELEEMGVVVDCSVDGVDPIELKKHFRESDFLRETFRSLSKIKRHYEKIVAGCYKNVRTPPHAPPVETADYMQHHYTPEQLKAAVIDFDDWEE